MIDLTGDSGGRAARPRRPFRRTVRTALIVIAVGLVAVAGRIGWQMVSEKDAVLSTPATIGPLRLDLSDDGRSKAAGLREELSAAIGLDTTVGAVYLDGTGNNVRFVGGTRLMWAPGSVLDSVFEAVADNEGALLGRLHSVNAGPLGGTLRCGGMTMIRDQVTVCGWADHGSLALAMFTGRDEPESARLLRQIRGASQTRP
jgi:hypothetical protein